MSRPSDPKCVTERCEISEFCLAAVVASQGRQNYMEDTFKIISNVNGSQISLFAVCDGHAGNFASQYTSDIIVPEIEDKIGNIFSIIQLRIEKLKIKKSKKEKSSKISEDENLNEENPLEKYITKENQIDFSQLINDEIASADKILMEVKNIF